MIDFKKHIIVLSAIILLYSCSSKKEEIVVGIQPLKEFNTEQLTTLKSTIEKYYGFKAHILPVVDLPENAFINIKTPRYRADILLDFLKKIKPDSINYMIGLTGEDISVTKKDPSGNVKQPEDRYEDWGVFGYGYMTGPSCIVSSFRINNKHKEYLARLKKICLHELGHNLGLDHCSDENCFMRDAAEKLSTIDNVKLDLCPKCKKEITND